MGNLKKIKLKVVNRLHAVLIFRKQPARLASFGRIRTEPYHYHFYFDAPDLLYAIVNLNEQTYGSELILPTAPVHRKSYSYQCVQLA